MHKKRTAAMLVMGLAGCGDLLDLSSTAQQDAAPSTCQVKSDCPDGLVCSSSRCTTPTVGAYRVEGADAMGLAVQTEPHINHVVGQLSNGDVVAIVCQTVHGDQVDGATFPGDTPFTTWDQLSDGDWVYDFYVNTPDVVNGYSRGIDHCPGG